MLAPDLYEAVFWDLFSGSGAVGLSALSRGARECVFVEEEREAITALRSNIAEAQRRLRQDEDSTATMDLLAMDLSKAWHRLLSSSTPDIVWADPPYSDSLRWADFFREKLTNLMMPGSLLVMEFATTDVEAAERLFSVDPRWESVKTRRYGEVSILIWRKHNDDAADANA